MRLKHLVLITTVWSTVLLSGCGTIGARAMTKNPPPFAGLRADSEAFDDLFKNKEEIKPAWMYWGLTVPLVSVIILADVPLSAAFDVLCLPADLKSQRGQAVESDAGVEE